MALAPFTFAHLAALALAGTAQLGDRHRLVELGDRAEHLAHQLGRRRVVDEGSGIIRCDQINSTLAQLGMSDLLHHQIASEPTRRLHDDGPHAVGLDAFEHGHEARSAVDGVRAAHGGIVEHVHEHVARAGGERRYRVTLSPVAVLVGSNVGR